MPRRLTNEAVRAEFEKYGYTLPDDFQHQTVNTIYQVTDSLTGQSTRLSLAKLRYRVAHNQRDEYVPILNIGEQPRIQPEQRSHEDRLNSNPIGEIMNIGQQPGKRNRGSFYRFVAHMDNEFKSKSKSYQRKVYSKVNDFTRQLIHAKNFSYNFGRDYEAELQALTEAMYHAGSKLSNDVRITIIDEDGNPDYRHLNQNTIDLMRLFYANEEYNITDSNDVWISTLRHIKSIHFEFMPPSQGRRKKASFYPYWNLSDIDLSRYGIFRNKNEKGVNDSCLVQAITSSGLLGQDELNMLHSIVKTRSVPRTELKQVADQFDLTIRAKWIDEKGEGHGANEPIGNGSKLLKLIVIDDHYILDEEVPVTKFYIKNYERIHKDVRVMNNPRRFMLSKLAKSYSYSKEGTCIRGVINKMKKCGMLVPMSQKDVQQLLWGFKRDENDNYDFHKPIIVQDKKRLHYHKDITQTAHFFGYKPDKDEVGQRIEELQEVIDSLGVHIDISLYYKFSELMQKIMYEYGCFKDVYSFTGRFANNLRSQLRFPKTRTSDDKPFYYHATDEKLYYLDLNGAYMSAVKYIPSGLPDENGDFDGRNEKVKELIERLYDARLKAKQDGNSKLATSLKFLMTSCWGYSIQRPKIVKNKFANNVDKYIDTFGPYVVSWKACAPNAGLGGNNVAEKGYVQTIQPVVIHYTYPQFAKAVLDEFNGFMDEIKSMVNVLYENVDAILVTESDYLKLKGLGYVDEHTLGKFKIEHIFTEIAILSNRRYVATTDAGEHIYHCLSSDIDYDEFVDNVKRNI